MGESGIARQALLPLLLAGSLGFLALMPLFMMTPQRPAPSAGPPSRPAVFQQVGRASWYGTGFQGKLTANGTRFNRHKLTAAHPSLPLGTKAEIVNIENGKSVQVTVTDRGPYVPGRIIDLSEKAAKQLDMKEDGVATVAIQAVPERPQEEAPLPNESAKQ